MTYLTDRAVQSAQVMERRAEQSKKRFVSYSEEALTDLLT